jgi:hypothetical protein
MGVLCRNAEHSIATLVWDRASLFLIFNHASGGRDSTDKTTLQVWRHKTLHPSSHWRSRSEYSCLL